MSKKCCKCNNIKDYTLFSKNKSTKDGFAKQCKECINNNYKNNSEKIIQSSKEYYKSNKEKIKKYKDEYYLENKEKLNKISKRYNENNKEKMSAKKKEYRIENRDNINIRYKEYLKSNNNAKIRHYLRSSLYRVLKSKNAKKSASIIKLIGCSIEFFMEYIEQKFTNNMNWENHGLYGWHLDHIRPCASFDLSDPEQQKICFHYTNYQPLWATTEIAIKYGEDSNYIGNLEKRDKYAN